ncbi:MAG: aminopeptidase N C-terminal domain-containing protein [Gammaproteobacteria bacterium]
MPTTWTNSWPPSALVHSNGSEKDQVIADFYQRWQREALVGGSVTSPRPLHRRQTRWTGGSLAATRRVRNHQSQQGAGADRAVLQRQSGNFHCADGEGYRFLADRIIQLNALNPQIASRMSTLLTRWRNYDDQRATRIREQLQRIRKESLSPDVYEVITKALG